MKLYLTLLVMINIATGAVGDVGVSDTDANSYMPYESGLSGQASLSQPTQGNYPVQDTSSQWQGSAYPAPQISGPMQEQLTAEELRLSLPQMESFAPDESLGFVSASLPGNTAQLVSLPVQSSVQATMPGSSIWYYPNSVVSANRFYVQTDSGFGTIGGCSFKGYLPLWADIKSSGNFFVYEWYPGQSTSSVKLWGWTGTGWKKGWFCGDIPGWHILCYNSGIWSNYIYIYVYPKDAAISASSGRSNAAPSMTATPLTLDAPIPPDPGAERIVLPDFNLYKPFTEEFSQSNSDAPFSSSRTGLVDNPAIANQALISYPDQAAYPGATSIAGGVSSSYPYEKSCPTCAASPSLTAPYGYAAQSYNAVYPVPSICRCNEYYVQSYQRRLATVAGVFCGEWLPLWSKVSRTGAYWSFEWTACSSGPSYYCPPEVKNFGNKNAGWYQTWFKGNNPGWHILSYNCNDWSNYIYIYVWSADQSLADQSV
jgi:hypothetical protein